LCGDVDIEMGDAVTGEGSAKETIPTMYRWVSSTREGKPGNGNGNAAERFMSLTFSVPVSAMREVPNVSTNDNDTQLDRATDVPTPQTGARCDVDGCTQPRKYRLVRDLKRGACGMSHLKLLDVA
jgi:Ino eighty subunit 2